MIEESRRLWLLSGVAIVVALVLLGGYLVFRGGPESKVTVRSVPNDLTLTLDGQPVAANGEVTVKEGTHTLVGQRAGFESHTQTIKVSDGKPLSVRMYLYSNSALGRDWEQKHPDQALEAEADAGRRFDERNRRITAKYPILQVLPYIGPGFKVDYGTSRARPDDPEQIALYVKLSSPTAKKDLLEWMRGHGYDPAAHEIVYTTR
jgi:hypothetical protein